MTQQPITKIWNRRFLCVFIANVLLYLGQSMVQALITKYVHTLDAPAMAVGFVASSFAMTALLFKVIAGPIIDTFRKERVLRWALLTMMISFLGYSFVKQIPLIIAFRLLQGVGQAFIATCYLALATDALPPDKIGAGIGTFTLAQAAGQAVAPAIGLWIADHYGFHTTFLFASCMIFCAVVMTFTMKSEAPAVKKRLRISPHNIFAREAILPSVLMTLLMCCFCLINSYLVIYATGQGVQNIGLYFTVYACTLLVTRPLLGKLSDRFGFQRVVIPALFCFAVSFFLISIADSLPMFLLAAFVAAFGFGASSPVINSLCMKSVPPERRGAASSTSYIGFDLGNLIGPALAAQVVEAGGYTLMWRVMTIPMFAAIAIVVIFRRRIQQIETDFQARSA